MRAILIRVSVLSVVVFVSTIGSGLSQSPDLEILRTGTFHSHEVSDQQAGLWLGVFETSSGWEIRSIRVDIQRAFDPISNDSREDPSTWTGWKVSTPDESEPLFLLRGLVDLEPGPLKTLFVGHTMVSPESPLFLGHPGSHVSLRAMGSRSDNGQQVSDYALSLWVGWGSEMRSQELVSARVADPVEDSIEVLWVGDLDQDRKPDLLLDTANHYNAVEYSLYLSSRAEGDELVRCVARFRSVGC